METLVKDQPTSELQTWGGLVVWIGICFGAAAIGSSFPIGDWYDQLNRPSWSPPNAVFGPVWSILYTCMAVAAWLVWKSNGIRGAQIPLTLFLVQLVLNAIWSWLFFGLHRIDLALAEIVVLFIAILVTMVLFFQRSRLAGCLLIPYLAWVGFASVLTFQYWRLN